VDVFCGLGLAWVGAVGDGCEAEVVIFAVVDWKCCGFLGHLFYACTHIFVAGFGLGPGGVALGVEVAAFAVFGDEGLEEDRGAVFPVVVAAAEVGADVVGAEGVFGYADASAFFGVFHPLAPFE
jgi:hypothetical protein